MKIDFTAENYEFTQLDGQTPREYFGDILRTNVIQSLNSQISNQKLIFVGIGGKKMLEARLTRSLFSINRLSIIGFGEILNIMGFSRKKSLNIVILANKIKKYLKMSYYRFKHN